jgi:L-threonylcarbamoyladenylate synthase
LRRGELAIIPTETVYGLAANALDEGAVAKIFAAKGRPSNNPLIVHISEPAGARALVEHWSVEAELLASRFWPGPLTLILPKSRDVPDLTTGGLSTVALRMPNHPLALEVIRLAGKPLAAPSANRFMATSPTRVEDIDPKLLPLVSAVVDGGPCRIGIESTVVDLSVCPPRVLRPGMLSVESIRTMVDADVAEEASPNSPGQYPRHYAPRAKVILVEKAREDSAALVFGIPTASSQLQMPLEPLEYSRLLYHYLHLLDGLGVPTIEVELPPLHPEWVAIHDRLRKASG